jgi:ParB/RepB/Spo0J family partition protein
MSQTLVDIPVEAIVPDPDNPRKTFEMIEDLAASISQAGLIQPIVVRPNGEVDHYFIVDGERRYRAVVHLGLPTIAAIVDDTYVADDPNITVAQLIANLQRDDLRPCDEAGGFAQMRAKGWLQEDIAAKVGVNQSYVSKRLSLLKLPADVQLMVDSYELDIRLAEELTKVKDPERVSQLASRHSLNEWQIQRVIDEEKGQAAAEKLHADALTKLAKVPNAVVYFGRDEIEEPRLSTHFSWYVEAKTLPWADIVKQLKSEFDSEIDYLVVELAQTTPALRWLRKAMAPATDSQAEADAKEQRRIQKEKTLAYLEGLRELCRKPRMAETRELAADVLRDMSTGYAREICAILDLAAVKTSSPTVDNPEAVRTNWGETLRLFLADAGNTDLTRATMAACLVHSWLPPVQVVLKANGLTPP